MDLGEAADEPGDTRVEMAPASVDGGVPGGASEGEAEGEDKVDTVKKKPKKKGNWKTIGHEPVNFELHPCLHKWMQKHPKGPCVQYKQMRWVVLPLSARIAQLALPLLRRLLALWLEFGDKFPPEMRARLMGFLTENYGLTSEFLEQILDEAKKAREGGEEKKPKKKKGKGKRKGKKKKKGKKKEPKEKEEPKAKAKDPSLMFKRRKAGKLPLDWPYKIGSKLLLNCISYLSSDPDEDYNSRASEYFDVQAMAILEQICQYMTMPLPDPEKPTQYGETLVIMALNLTDWIAKFVTAPAQAIPDKKVDELLELRGMKPKQKSDKGKKLSKKDKGKKEPEKRVETVEPVTPAHAEIDPETEMQRNWNEMKAPVFIPEKSRISRRKRRPNAGGDEGDENDVGYATDTDMPVEEGVPRWVEQTLDDVKQNFLEYINWYNPWEPEFMYMGPRLTPRGIAMFKIWHPDTDEIPSDLRALNWNQISYGYVDNYSFIPSPVPQYYPALRPLRPIRLENVERSGIPKEIIKRDLRFFSPWFLMRVPLKPSPPRTPEQLEEEQGEFYDEELEDEMHSPEKPPPIRDSLWGDPKMREQIEILGHLIHMMSSVPDLTLDYVFETLDEFCEAVALAEKDENPSPENELLLKKRTIILEQYYFAFFGKKFRDYNDRTPRYMRVICRRLAYYIQILYEYTARILWELQSRPNPPTPIPTPPETPDDPDSLQNWDDWLAWLMKVTKTCDDWAGWISETVTEAERKAAKKKLEFIGPDGEVQILTTDEWFRWKSEVERKVFDFRSAKKRFTSDSPYYMEISKGLLPVRHRETHCVEDVYEEAEDEEMDLEDEEEDEEEDDGEGDDDLDGEDGEGWSGKKKGKRGKRSKNEAITDDETEWEDVGEDN